MVEFKRDDFQKNTDDPNKNIVLKRYSFWQMCLLEQIHEIAVIAATKNYRFECTNKLFEQRKTKKYLVDLQWYHESKSTDYGSRAG